VAGTVTLTSSSANGASLVGPDGSGLTLKVRSLTTSSNNIEIAADSTGKEINLRTLITRHMEPSSILGTGPWGETDSRLSISYNDMSPSGWLPALLPLSVPSLYWKGTLVDAVVTPNILLDSAGYFNVVLNGLRTGVPFDMYATVRCLTAFNISFTFCQLAGGSLKKWDAVLTSSTGTTADTMERILMTTTPYATNSLDFSTETVPRPILDSRTTSPEGLFVRMTQDTTGIYPVSGTDIWIFGIDFVFG
jgi:hypothetical protein